MPSWTFRLIAFTGAFLVGIVGSLLLNSPLSCGVPIQEVVVALDSSSGAYTSIPNFGSSKQGEEEVFSDEVSVGRPGKNKVVIRCYEEGPKAFAEISFYFLSNTSEWKSRIAGKRIEKHPNAVCDPKIIDFNNDGFGDVAFESNVAARGANEIRTLLLYNKKDDSLDLIENSTEYPNLEYNKALDCITAWAFHGATTTIFLKIEGRRLREFASVDTGAERVVTITRTNGQSVVVRREKMNEKDIYTRYTTFNPPR